MPKSQSNPVLETWNLAEDASTGYLYPYLLKTPQWVYAVTVISRSKAAKRQVTKTGSQNRDALPLCACLRLHLNRPCEKIVRQEIPDIHDR